jgi:hypothetical protein
METIQVLRRLLKRTVEGNTETNVFERIEQEVLTDQEVQELIDQFGDDPEQAYSIYGLAFGMDDDLAMIVLDALSSGLEDYLKDCDEDMKSPILESILKKVAPLHQYNLDFESVPDKETKSVPQKGAIGNILLAKEARASCNLDGETCSELDLKAASEKTDEEIIKMWIRLVKVSPA